MRSRHRPKLQKLSRVSEAVDWARTLLRSGERREIAIGGPAEKICKAEGELEFEPLEVDQLLTSQETRKVFY